MKKTSSRKNPVLEYAVLGVVIIAAIFLFQWIRSQDVNFCRYVFSNLVNGRSVAERHIDWEKLIAMGVDVGGTYVNLPNDVERARYRKVLISSISSSFYKTGGNLRQFVNWRVKSKSAGQTVVAADTLKGNLVLLCTLSGSGKKKLTSLLWVAK